MSEELREIVKKKWEQRFEGYENEEDFCFYERGYADALEEINPIPEDLNQFIEDEAEKYFRHCYNDNALDKEYEWPTEIEYFKAGANMITKIFQIEIKRLKEENKALRNKLYSNEEDGGHDPCYG